MNTGHPFTGSPSEANEHIGLAVSHGHSFRIEPNGMSVTADACFCL
jgi:hypothetical protein